MNKSIWQDPGQKLKADEGVYCLVKRAILAFGIDFRDFRFIMKANTG